MADYPDASRFFPPDGLLRGSKAIRRFFAVLFEEFEKPGMSFELLRQEISGDTAYIVWTAETADNRFEVGTDTFIVQNGKIVTKLLRGRFRRSTDFGLHGFQQGVGMSATDYLAANFEAVPRSGSSVR